MGLFDFVKSAGAKITNLFDDDDEISAEEKAAAEIAAAEDQEKWNVGFSKWLVRQVAQAGHEVENLDIAFSDSVATIKGTAADQETREKVVLTVGNAEKVGQVDDQMDVAIPADPAVFYQVQKGDSLSAIAKSQYGVMTLYPVIFEANKPMLNHPDEIFPGQVLRIPAATAPVHTVASGETLGAIAKTYYGSAKHYTRIVENNRNVLSDPNKIKVGQELVIPLVLPAPVQNA